MEEPVKTKRGFAAMSPEEHRRVASLGGKAVPAASRGFSNNPEAAAAAGRKGGKAVSPEKRTFAKNPALAREAGRKGGQSTRQPV